MAHVLEPPPDDLWVELEEVRRQVEHLYHLREQVGGQLSPRQIARYRALLLREQLLLRQLAQATSSAEGAGAGAPAWRVSARSASSGC